MAGRPRPHPWPPAAFRGIPLPLIASKGPWFRIHPAGLKAIHFGKTGGNRFDDPLRRYRVLYLSFEFAGAFIETAGHRTGIRLVTRAWLEDRRLSRITSRRAFRLVDLTGSGRARLGADSRLFSGDYRISQAWSCAFWNHPSRPEGIQYRSRLDPSRYSVALFDRGNVRRKLKSASFGHLLSDDIGPLLADAMKEYGFGVV